MDWGILVLIAFLVLMVVLLRFVLLPWAKRQQKKRYDRKWQEFYEKLEIARRERAACHKSKESVGKNVDASRYSDFLGCRCETFEFMSGPQVAKVYREKLEEGRKKGFYPVIFTPEFFNHVCENASGDFSSEETARKRRIEEALKVDFPCVLAHYLKIMHDNHTKEELTTKGDCCMDPTTPSEVEMMLVGEPGEMLILAEIPATHPWEIFAWLPFGGWNECPDWKDHVAFARHWYERNGAVPATFRQDSVEYYVKTPVPEDDASALALEQYAYCPDVVDQGEPLPELQEELTDSRVWFFWWD